MPDLTDVYECRARIRFRGPFDDELRQRVEDILDDLLPRVTAPDMFDDDAPAFEVSCDIQVEWVNQYEIVR